MLFLSDSLQALSDLVEADIVGRELAAIVVTLAKDGVPNVRLNVARTIERLLPKADQQYVSPISLSYDQR